MFIFSSILSFLPFCVRWFDFPQSSVVGSLLLFVPQGLGEGVERETQHRIARLDDFIHLVDYVGLVFNESKWAAHAMV